MTARQLALPLPARPALGREDFYVTEANKHAVSQIDNWRNWSAQKLVLVGPEGSGKSHLAGVWARQASAQIVPATTLLDADIPALAQRPVCVEDVPRLAGQRVLEEALFHLHNLVLSNDQTLLLTARTPPVVWPLVLPDLKSRILAADVASLAEPDDDLLSAVLAKLFADRQIVPAPDVIPYLTRHMPRSYAAAQLIVEHLDAAALGRPKGVSRPLARDVLAVTFDTDASHFS